MRRSQLRPEFVDYIPDVVIDGVLYVSVRFATASHRCACGCGELVVTPIRPTDWRLTWDGETVSLYPSIGNWSLGCRSHYWIRENRVVWASDWSDRQIRGARTRDAREKARYFGSSRHSSPNPPSRPPRSLVRRGRAVGTGNIRSSARDLL
jgi:hypothetical protein